MLIYDLLSFCSRARDAPRILSRRICNVHRVILHVVFSARSKTVITGSVLDTRPRPSRCDLRKSRAVSLDLRPRDFDLRVAVRYNFKHGRTRRERMRHFSHSRERLGNANLPLRKLSNFPEVAILSEVHKDEDDSLSG